MKPDKRLILGICCGVLAAIFTAMYISGARAEALTSREAAIKQYGGETCEVCVATRDIASGEVIAQSDITMQTWIVDLLPSGAIVDDDEVVGKTAQTAILQNEVFAQAKVGQPTETLTVPSGLCAVTVPSKDVQAVGGALSAGAVVNVYATSESSVRLLGQNILVLETSNSGYSRESTSAFGNASSRASVSWVTLAVTPESVSELIAASKTESLYLTLPATSVDTTESLGKGE